MGRPLEPGVLGVMRAIIGFRLLLWIYEAGGRSLPWGIEFKSPGENAALIVTDVALIVVLSWLIARPDLARRSFPFLLVAGALPMVFETYWLYRSFDLTPLVEESATGSLPITADLILWQVVIAWQYGLRPVITFQAAFAVFDLALLYSFATPGSAAYTLTVETIILSSAVAVIVGYVIVQLVNRLRDQREQLALAHQAQRTANRRLAEQAAEAEANATTAERHRLARELHDTLAHSLSALTIQLEAVATRWDDDPVLAHDLLVDAKSTARSGLQEARGALDALRATPVERVGLPVALQELADETARRHGVEVMTDLATPTGSSAAIDHALYRVAQEALRNAVQHSGAATIVVTLVWDDDDTELTVTDDGVGIGPHPDAAAGWGIEGMLERADELEGTLRVGQTRSGGTTVALRLPLACDDSDEVAAS